MSSEKKQDQRKLSRRDFLKIGAGVAGAGILTACAPEVVTQVVKETIEVEKEVEVPVEVEVEVTKEVVTEVEVAAPDPWLTGQVPPTESGVFRITGWEGEGEMRKWLLHIDRFFNKYYPNMEVDVNWGVPWGDYWTTLPAQIAGGGEIEMIWMHDSRTHVFGTMGLMLPLDEYLDTYTPPDWPDRYYPSQVDAFKHEGVQYAIPYDWAPGGFYVNLDMIEEAGVSVPDENTTWDELLEMALKMTKDTDGDGVMDQWGLGGIPQGWSGGAYWIVKSFGGDYWDEGLTESKFLEQGTIDVMQFIADLLWEHKVHPSADLLEGVGMGAELAFASGLIGVHYALNDVSFRMNEAIGGAFEWTVAPTPTGPAGRFQFSGGSAWAIPVTSTQPDMAYELITWVLCNPDNLPTTAVMGGSFVGHMDFYEFGLPPAATGVDQEAYKHAFYDLGKRDPCYPNYHAMYQEWEGTVWVPCFDPMWIGEERNAEAACQCAHEGTNEILAQL
jgi:multiple sugar transport system substrate-binding protein